MPKLNPLYLRAATHAGHGDFIKAAPCRLLAFGASGVFDCIEVITALPRILVVIEIDTLGPSHEYILFAAL